MRTLVTRYVTWEVRAILFLAVAAFLVSWWMS